MSESSANPDSCPKCGAALPLASTAGLCPRCLMAEAMAATQGEAEATPPQRSLTPAELAPHFPQLEIIECLGRGGMGVVYRARQKTLNRLVALKLLAPERVADAKFAQRFTQEAQALAALNHPNIVTIYDFGQAGGFYYLLMEFVDGVNLRQAMKAERFTPEQALAIVPPVCEALQYAHEHGIVHRDIKPENLLLDKEGRVKIADFGIAKMLGADGARLWSETQPQHPGHAESAATGPADTAALQRDPTLASAAGTPQYMAPEQKEHRVTDHRADIYSLGVVLYELLTGELPADKLQPPSRKVQIDVRLDEIVLRALEAKPERRYQTAGDFRTKVETIATSLGASDSPGINPPKAVPFRYHSPRRFRDRWLWDYNVIALVASILMVVPTVLVFSLLPALGNKAHWFWLLFLLPLGYIVVYEIVARRMRQLRERAYPQAQEMAEVLMVHLPVQTPAIAVLTAENLELIGIAGSPLVIPRADIESIEQIRWFNGQRLWWKMGLRIQRRSTTPVLLAVAEPVGQRWMRILKGESPNALDAEPDAAPQAKTNWQSPTTRQGLRAPIFSVIWSVVFIALIATGNARVMLIGSAILMLVGLIWFSKGNFRYALLVALAAIGVAFVAVMLLSNIIHRPAPIAISSWQSAKAINPVEFGPVIERVITLSNDAHSFYSFDRGDYVPGPAPFDLSDANEATRNELWKWNTQNHVDLFARARNGRPTLVRSEMICRDLNEDDFDNLTPVQLEADPTWTSLLSAQTRSQETSTLSRGTLRGSKDTFMFQTRYDVIGVVQAVGVTSDPPGVKIRYKLLQTGTPVAPQATEPPDLRLARARLAELRVNYGEQQHLVQASLARVKELERMAQEEPDAPADLREAKANLAELRVDYGQQHRLVQEALARIKALEQNGNGSEEASVTLAKQPPVVVETFPVSGARDVAPGVTDIRVRFSKPMTDASWSWTTAWEDSTPEFIGTPHYEADGRTCVAKVKLEPGRTYAFWLNSAKFLDFRDAENRPAIPYLLTFQTQQN